jgi:hypothetical protein
VTVQAQTGKVVSYSLNKAAMVAGEKVLIDGSSRPGRGTRYQCAATNLGANAAGRDCRTSILSSQVDGAVLAEVFPLFETMELALPELRDALERAWIFLRRPALLQDERQERQRQQLLREAEHARSRLTRAAVLFADGNIDKAGYELVRDKAQADLHAATQALERLQQVEPSITLPPLETVLAAADGWGAAMRGGDITAQREVLAALIEWIVPVRIGRGHYAVEITWTPLGDGLQAAVLGSAHAERSAA